MFRQSGLQMNRDFENLAARAAPSIFVVLWSTGFIGTKYVTAVVMAYVLFDERLDTIAIIGMVACAAAVFVVNRRA